MNNLFTAESRRLVLRPFCERDLPALRRILTDEKTNVFLPWFPPCSERELRALAEKRFLPAQDAVRLAVCLKEDAAPFGYVTVEGAAHDLGYGFLPETWGRGYATEACAALIGRLRAERAPLPFLTATHDKNNPASGAVMRKLGMRYCYSYREQWMPKNLSVLFRMYQLDLYAPQPVYGGYLADGREHVIEAIE